MVRGPILAIAACLVAAQEDSHVLLLQNKAHVGRGKVVADQELSGTDESDEQVFMQTKISNGSWSTGNWSDSSSYGNWSDGNWSDWSSGNWSDFSAGNWSDKSYGNWSDHGSYGNWSDHGSYGNWSDHGSYGNWSDHGSYGNWSDYGSYGNWSDKSYGNWSEPGSYGNWSDYGTYGNWSDKSYGNWSDHGSHGNWSDFSAGNWSDTSYGNWSDHGSHGNWSDHGSYGNWSESTFGNWSVDSEDVRSPDDLMAEASQACEEYYPFAHDQCMSCGMECFAEHPCTSRAHCETHEGFLMCHAKCMESPLDDAMAACKEFYPGQEGECMECGGKCNHDFPCNSREECLGNAEFMGCHSTCMTETPGNAEDVRPSDDRLAEASEACQEYYPFAHDQCMSCGMECFAEHPCTSREHCMSHEGFLMCHAKCMESPLDEAMAACTEFYPGLEGECMECGGKCVHDFPCNSKEDCMNNAEFMGCHSTCMTGHFGSGAGRGGEATTTQRPGREGGAGREDTTVREGREGRGECDKCRGQTCTLAADNLWKPEDLPPYFQCLSDCCQDFDPELIFDGITCDRIQNEFGMKCDDELQGMRNIPEGTRLKHVCPQTCNTCCEAL